MNQQRTADDYIYTSNSLDSIPHRIRVRQVIAELKRLAPRNCRYADVGCGGGFVTERIVEAIQPRTAVGYDLNQELIANASKQFTDISFRVWDASTMASPADKFDLVTCLETLEHVGNLKFALDNLLAVTTGILFLTVPIEIGVFGTLKFTAKRLLQREVLGAEHTGLHIEYFQALITGGDISRFRTNFENDHWVSHTGFDYRKIDEYLRDTGSRFIAQNRGWNRFYVVDRLAARNEQAPAASAR